MDAALLTSLKSLLHETIGLITIFNPLAAAAIMVAATPEGLTRAEARRIAKKASVTVLAASLLTILLGNLAFRLFGINTASIMVIGGLVLLIMALNMVQGKVSDTSHSPEESEAAVAKEDISVIPIGIPVVFGPGVISTLMVFHAAGSGMTDTVLLLAAVAAAVTVVFIVLSFADTLTKALGVHGMKIMTRIMGLIVGAIAVQFVIRGAKLLWGTL